MDQPHRKMKIPIFNRLKVRYDVHTPCMFVTCQPEHLQVGLYLSPFNMCLLCNQLVLYVLGWLCAKSGVMISLFELKDFKEICFERNVVMNKLCDCSFSFNIS